MPLFTYRWIDLLRLLPGALTPPRLAVGTVLAAWCVTACVALTGLIGQSPLDALGLIAEAESTSQQVTAPRWLDGIFADILVICVLLVWWCGFCWLKLWLMRAEVLRIALNESRPVPKANAYARHFALRLARAPLALLPWLVGASLLGIPLAILAFLVALFVPDLDPLTLGLLVLAAPAALVLSLWVLTLPLSFAAMAIHGGDGFEAVSRSLSWGLRGARWYAPVAILTHAGVAILLSLTAGEIASALRDGGAGAILAWLCAAGAVLAAWTSTDVVTALLVRHRVDQAPVSEVFDPRRVFTTRISSQERSLTASSQSD